MYMIAIITVVPIFCVMYVRRDAKMIILARIRILE